MAMIRLPPTQIVPSRDDIHAHIEQIFDRLYERLRALEPECFDDDFGDDLASLIDADVPSSFRSSPAADEDYDSEASSAFNPDYEYKRYPSSQLEDYEIDDGISMSDSRVIERPHPRQYPGSDISDTTDEDSYEYGSYETAMESDVGMQEDGLGSSLPSSRMSYGELIRAPPHSLEGHRRSFGRRVASGTYQHHERMHSLFPIRHLNPRLLFAFPQYSTQFSEIQQDALSLGSLFESLSLNTLPGLNHSRLGTKGKENQPPQPANKEKTSKLDRDLDSKLVSFNEAKTRSIQFAHPIHQTSPNSRDNKMPGSIQDERNMSQADVHMSDVPEPDTTESGSNSTLRVPNPVSQNRGKRARASAGSRISAASGDTKSKRRTSQVPSGSETSSSSSKRGSHATGAASNQTGRTVSRWTELSRPATRRTSWHPINAPQGQKGRRQAANRGRVNSTGQSTSRTTSTAQTHTSSSRPTTIQSSAPLASNNIQRPATSTHTTPATQNQPSTAQSVPATTAPAPTGINMPPQTALNPEKWKHMMELSQVYREHVSDMLTEMEKDEDNANGFGLGELRRRPLGDMFD